VELCPGFNVTGNFAPGNENPVPLTLPALTVKAPVPDEVMVTDCVAGVFIWTLPNPTVVELRLRLVVVAFRVRANVFDTPAAVAVNVAVCVVLTAVAVAVKLALVAPDPIVTDAGTVTALLLLVSATVVPALAAAVSVTVHASVPAPVSDPLLQESALRLAGACPVPLSATVAVDALLLIATDPLKLPAVVGSKLIVSVAT
jgi:hypothetical protein